MTVNSLKDPFVRVKRAPLYTNKPSIEYAKAGLYDVGITCEEKLQSGEGGIICYSLNAPQICAGK